MTTDAGPVDAGDLDAGEGTDDADDGVTVAYELVNEVLNAAMVNRDGQPLRLTGAEHMVLVVIAEECRNLATRTCQLDRVTMARRAKVTPDTVRNALRGLARKGLDPRVAIPGLYGSDDRPVYAYPGRPTTYRLPVLVDEPDKPDDDEDAPGDDGKGGQSAPPKGGRSDPPGRRKGGRSDPPSGRSRLDREAIDACRYCDHVAQVLGIDGTPTVPAVKCGRHRIVIE